MGAGSIAEQNQGRLLGLEQPLVCRDRYRVGLLHAGKPIGIGSAQAQRPGPSGIDMRPRSAADQRKIIDRARTGRACGQYQRRAAKVIRQRAGQQRACRAARQRSGAQGMDERAPVEHELRVGHGASYPLDDYTHDYLGPMPPGSTFRDQTRRTCGGKILYPLDRVHRVRRAERRHQAHQLLDVVHLQVDGVGVEGGVTVV